MIGAIVTGTLTADPVERTTQAGKTFVTATARVSAGEDAIFIGLAAFSETAAARLLQMRAGGVVSASTVAATKKRRAAEGGEE